MFIFLVAVAIVTAITVSQPEAISFQEYCQLHDGKPSMCNPQNELEMP